MIRTNVLPVAASVIHVLDRVLADLNRYLTIEMHEQLRRSDPRRARGSERQPRAELRREPARARARLGAPAAPVPGRRRRPVRNRTK